MSRINLLLISAICVGALFAWHSGQKRNRFQAEYARLAQITGDLPIDDPSRVYLRALPTEEPLHFAWRVYLPPNYRQILKSTSGGSSSSWSSNAVECIARVRLKENEKGAMQVYARFHGGSSMMTIGDRKITKLLAGRWDSVHVQQLASDGLVSLAPDESAVLLRLTLPQDLQDQLRTSAKSEQEGEVPIIYDLKFEPKAANP
jgi:hypothetical protein